MAVSAFIIATCHALIGRSMNWRRPAEQPSTASWESAHITPAIFINTYCIKLPQSTSIAHRLAKPVHQFEYECFGKTPFFKMH